MNRGLLPPTFHVDVVNCSKFPLIIGTIKFSVYNCREFSQFYCSSAIFPLNSVSFSVFVCPQYVLFVCPHLSFCLSVCITKNIHQMRVLCSHNVLCLWLCPFQRRYASSKLILFLPLIYQYEYAYLENFIGVISFLGMGL